MIAWSKYFHFNAEDVEYIEAIDSTSGEYPYRLDGTLLSWLASWRMKTGMLVAFLLENVKLSEKD